MTVVGILAGTLADRVIEPVLYDQGPLCEKSTDNTTRAPVDVNTGKFAMRQLLADGARCCKRALRVKTYGAIYADPQERAVEPADKKCGK